VNFEVQVRCGGVARIATEGDELPLGNRYLHGRQSGISHTGLMPILITAKGCLDAGREGLQVTIDRGLPRGMSDIDGIAEAVKPNGDTRYIAIGNSIDMLALYTIRSDVETAMKMIGTRFTEIPRQRDFIIHWRGKYT
jgi:hypothetical protein